VCSCSLGCWVGSWGQALQSKSVATSQRCLNTHPRTHPPNTNGQAAFGANELTAPHPHYHAARQEGLRQYYAAIGGDIQESSVNPRFVDSRVWRECLTPDQQEFIRAMLQPHPDMHATTEQLLELPYFQKVTQEAAQRRAELYARLPGERPELAAWGPPPGFAASPAATCQAAPAAATAVRQQPGAAARKGPPPGFPAKPVVLTAAAIPHQQPGAAARNGPPPASADLLSHPRCPLQLRLKIPSPLPLPLLTRRRRSATGKRGPLRHSKSSSRLLRRQRTPRRNWLLSGLR